MDSLVYQKNSAIVTDSLTIAKVFQKRHDKVLRDIKNLSCSEQFKVLNFGESSYFNKQGRKMPLYIIKENGFYILAMGYTGDKAMAFKEQYINEFQRMRTILESRKEHRLTLVSKQQNAIKDAVRTRIMLLYPSVRDNARRKYYARIYQQLKAKCGVESYRDINSLDFDFAMKFIQDWDSPKLASATISENLVKG
ncbi:Rha family transcriptional regulator [Sporolactobacillus nakayamae]|uniref:Phage regulatory protein, rha family n=1 Tax=Sporolactobacillus nakayamae TaxID=269670 RepID=A0A1I2P3H4_9BACL|nr:Rha family transcriptional regulator [Sporolactobacillus nakayamae]SFG10113.1 phage regulatory protein, rha family [Sporolactobacillus nakayamae]